MNDLKMLLKSVPFRTFPQIEPPVQFHQSACYQAKFNPISHHKLTATQSALPTQSPSPQLSTIAPTVPVTPSTAAAPHPNPTVVQNIAQRTVRTSGREVDQLSQLLIEEMDDLSSMYSREWMRDAAQQIKEKLVAFLIEPNVVKALGRKKTCDAIYFFETRPKPDEARAKNLGWILSFIFDKVVYINDKKCVWNAKQGLANELRLTHSANGRWSISFGPKIDG